MGELFEKWLIEHEFKSPQTAYQYSKAINRISRHYSSQIQKGIDLYTLQDLEELEEIAFMYGTSGKFSDYGHNGNGTNRAAIKSLCRFRENNINTTYSPRSFQPKKEKQNYDFVLASHGFSSKNDLKQSLIHQIDVLFPKFKIYGSDEKGIDFPVEEKRVDVLLEKENGDLLALEIIPGLATSSTFGNFSLLLGLLFDHFPDRTIKGCIIAGEIDKTLQSAVRLSDFIFLKNYTIKLELHSDKTDSSGRSSSSFLRNFF